jgi:hypothetical protein
MSRHFEAAQGRVVVEERLAAEVRQADAACRDRRARARLAEPHLGMLARTAADSHGTTELAEIAEFGGAMRQALREG